MLVGLPLGFASAFGLSRLLGGMLYGVNATDPITYGGAALALLCVTVLACCLPARRATQTDPMIVLRHV
jgi:ABC-type antimicrobial peptide transport system permease subunit